MNYRATIDDLSIKGYLYARQFFPFLLIAMALICLMPDSCFASENRLAGLKADVGATFGADSDLPYFLLLGVVPKNLQKVGFQDKPNYLINISSNN